MQNKLHLIDNCEGDGDPAYEQSYLIGRDLDVGHSCQADSRGQQHNSCYLLSAEPECLAFLYREHYEIGAFLV